MQHTTKISDMTELGNQPTITDVWRLVIEIRDRLEKVERQQEEHVTAFSFNDLNKPDFDGHRRSHAKLVKSDELVESYKQDVTKKILGMCAVFILGLLSTGIFTKAVELIK